MDIQALEILSNLAAITTKQGSGDAEVVSGDFSRLLNEINTMQSVSDMQEEICKKFNVTLHVVDYACNTTDQSHIRNIREKIEDNPSKPVYIQTVWGVGYRFNKNLSSGL